MQISGMWIRRVFLVGACALPLVAFAAPKKAKSSSPGTTKAIPFAELTSIETNADGTLQRIQLINRGADNKPVVMSGCGAKLADLPHLTQALDGKHQLAVWSTDNCLTKLLVRTTP